MKMPAASAVRRWLPRPTRKLAIEFLFAGIAIASVLVVPQSPSSMILSSYEQGSDRGDGRTSRDARPENIRMKQFMEHVALSYVANPRTRDALVITDFAGPGHPAISPEAVGR